MHSDDQQRICQTLRQYQGIGLQGPSSKWWRGRNENWQLDKRPKWSPLFCWWKPI